MEGRKEGRMDGGMERERDGEGWLSSGEAGPHINIAGGDSKGLSVSVRGS